MRARLLLGFALVLGPGCGSGKFAPVSGTVTLNGKPLAGALVIFSPVAKPGPSWASTGCRSPSWAGAAAKATTGAAPASW